MKQTLVLPLVIGALACILPAQGQVQDAATKTAAAKEYAALKTGFDKAQAEYNKKARAVRQAPELKAALDKARETRERADFDKYRELSQKLMEQAKLKPPLPEWLPKFQAAAKKYQGDDQAGFLVWICTRSSGAPAKTAFEALLENHSQSELMIDVIKGAGVARAFGRTGGAHEAYARIIEKSPHNLVKAYAYFYRAQAAQRKRDATADDKKAAEADLAQVLKLAPKGSTLALKAAGPQFERERLQVGMIAPDITGEDIDGVKFKLSDYRGKVVVIDFWGDW